MSPYNDGYNQAPATYLPHCSECHRLLKVPYPDFRGRMVEISEDEHDKSILFMSNVWVGSPIERHEYPVNLALCPECQEKMGLTKFVEMLMELTEKTRREQEEALTAHQTAAERQMGARPKIIRPGDPDAPAVSQELGGIPGQPGLDVGTVPGAVHPGGEAADMGV